MDWVCFLYSECLSLGRFGCRWAISFQSGRHFAGMARFCALSVDRAAASGVLSGEARRCFFIRMDKQDRIGIIIFALGGMLFHAVWLFCRHCPFQCRNRNRSAIYRAGADCGLSGFGRKSCRQSWNVSPFSAVWSGQSFWATHGNLKSLSLSPQALFWGALSSIALAFYTVYPVRLLAKYDAMLLIGWSILVLSFVMHFVHPSWDYAGNWNTSTVLAMVFIVIFGTTIPYLMFLNGVKYIGPTKSSLYASAEPLASTIVSVVWLKVHLEFIDYIGFVFIVAAVLLLSFVNPAPKEKENT